MSDKAALVADLLAHARFLEGLDTVGVAWPRAGALLLLSPRSLGLALPLQPLRTARQA